MCARDRSHIEPDVEHMVPPQPAHEPSYVEMALDASCAALTALDLVRTFAAEDERVTGRITLAIAALRHAIEDLRGQLHGSERLPSAFVTSSDSEPPRERHVPRRTDRFVA